MMSLKYIVDNNEYNPPLSDEFYEYVGSSGKFHAYRNKYWLPIAYCVNEDITAWSFDSDNPFEVQNDYFSAQPESMKSSTGLISQILISITLILFR